MLRRLITSLVLFFALGAAAAEPHAVALMYHHVGVSKYPSTNVTIEQFEAHLDYLAENDYRVMALSEVVDRLRAGEDLPDNVAVITFDDAYRSVYTEAYPRLKERGWPFTVFVNTDGVDGDTRTFLGWPELREMARHGAEYGNHSASHDYLARGELAAAKADIEKAWRRLDAELDAGLPSDPRLFAYPFGEYTPALAEWLQESGYVGFGQHSGVLGPDTDWRAAPRFPVNERYADLEELATKLAARPMPVAREEPFDPRVSDNPPALTLHLSEPVERPDALACYLGGERMDVEWLQPGRSFRVRAETALPEGRSRYNCTVPTGAGYRWYSHLWLNLD